VLKVKEFFGFESMAQFRKEWQELTEDDKLQLREGLRNGTLTY
jgi:hypothetical protein